MSLRLFKKILIIVPILLFVGGGLFFTLSKRDRMVLISPFFKGKDQTDKISQKISGLVLDFSKSKELTTLEKVPRYLAYNQDSGVVYYSKGADVRMSPASFTKLLSTYIKKLGHFFSQKKKLTHLTLQ